MRRPELPKVLELDLFHGCKLSHQIPKYVKLRLAVLQGSCTQPKNSKTCLRHCGHICASGTSPSCEEDT